MSTSDVPPSGRATGPDLLFVSPQRYPDEAPPLSTTGILGWLRENLFSSWSNGFITLVCFVFLATILPGIIEWAILKAVWNAQSLTECREIIKAAHGEGVSGACWAVIKERYNQLLYGFYPEELRWRPNVAFALMVVAVVPVLFRTMRPATFALLALVAIEVLAHVLRGDLRPVLLNPTVIVAVCAAAITYVFGGAAMRARWLWFSLAYPVIAYVLLWGGLGLEHVPSARFGGFLLTMVIGVTGIVGSLPLGILLALGRQSKLPILQFICVTFIEFIRGVPLITLLFVASTLLNYFTPPGTDFDLILRVLIMVTLFASAYMAEVIRGGLAALPRGQYEAADTLGLKYWQGMRLILLPQALKISIPGIVNTFIGLFKDTTLVSVIGLLDPLGFTKPIRSDTAWNGIVWELYGFIALLFFVFCWGMSRYSMYLETRLRAADSR